MKDIQKQRIQPIINAAFRMNAKERVRNGYKEYDIEMLYPGSNNCCYWVNNSVCTFECEDQVYVVPVIVDGIIVKNLLDSAGFMERAMYVPFSNGEYPVDRLDEYNRVFHKSVELVSAV